MPEPATAGTNASGLCAVSRCLCTTSVWAGVLCYQLWHLPTTQRRTEASYLGSVCTLATRATASAGDCCRAQCCSCNTFSSTAAAVHFLYRFRAACGVDKGKVEKEDEQKGKKGRWNDRRAAAEAKKNKPGTGKKGIQWIDFAASSKCQGRGGKQAFLRQSQPGRVEVPSSG